jgi:phosphoribosylformylglycinamidine cyclo-ligase
MPGMYAAGDYDLAGFCVGVVERDAILDGSQVRPGDVILGLASSGPHSNGYSLVRRILDRDGTALGETLADGARLGDALMAPTRIYVRPLLDSLRRQPGQIHALAHITGGGLTENVPRVLPRGCHARIATGAWPWPPVFEWLAERGPVAQHEMLRTFNCGIGMVVVCDAARADVLAQQLTEAGERVYRIGSIEACDGDARISIE